VLILFPSSIASLCYLPLLGVLFTPPNEAPRSSWIQWSLCRTHKLLPVVIGSRVAVASAPLNKIQDIGRARQSDLGRCRDLFQCRHLVFNCKNHEAFVWRWWLKSLKFYYMWAIKYFSLCMVVNLFQRKVGFLRRKQLEQGLRLRL
jgi:hypothetical protein